MEGFLALFAVTFGTGTTNMNCHRRLSWPIFTLRRPVPSLAAQGNPYDHFLVSQTLCSLSNCAGLYRALTLAAQDNLLNDAFFWIPSLAGPASLADQRAVSRFFVP